MEYTIGALAKLAGISVRTLRYYEQISLLSPSKRAENGYRLYDEAAVDRLQRILFCRTLGMQAESIAAYLNGTAAREQLLFQQEALLRERERLDERIETLRRTLAAAEKGIGMNDTDKFRGLGERAARENEAQYGKEARALYGNDQVNAVQSRLTGMTDEAWRQAEQLRVEAEESLREALGEGDPCSPAARRAIRLHRAWMCCFFGKGGCTPSMQLCLAETYVGDPRFTAYYDEHAGKGSAAFLKEALQRQNEV